MNNSLKEMSLFLKISLPLFLLDQATKLLIINNFELGDTINISDIELPKGAETTIQGRDFVIANIQAPSGLKSADNEEETENEVDEEVAEEE